MQKENGSTNGLKVAKKYVLTVLMVTILMEMENAINYLKTVNKLISMETVLNATKILNKLMVSVNLKLENQLIHALNMVILVKMVKFIPNGSKDAAKSVKVVLMDTT